MSERSFIKEPNAASTVEKEQSENQVERLLREFAALPVEQQQIFLRELQPHAVAAGFEVREQERPRDTIQSRSELLQSLVASVQQLPTEHRQVILRHVQKVGSDFDGNRDAATRSLKPVQILKNEPVLRVMKMDQQITALVSTLEDGHALEPATYIIMKEGKLQSPVSDSPAGAIVNTFLEYIRLRQPEIYTIMLNYLEEEGGKGPITEENSEAISRSTRRLALAEGYNAFTAIDLYPVNGLDMTTQEKEEVARNRSGRNYL